MSTFKIYWTLALAVSATAKEVGVPERFLRPRNFNPHPFIATQGSGAEVDNNARLLEEHPYHLFQRVNVRGEDDNRPIQFPKVPEVAKPTKSKTPGYITVPKNYAFSYAVRDKQSGDDFSHSQAHNGQATQGEYRVKLPDGRIQVVSYTADSTGYRADVRYDKDNTLTVRKLSHLSDNILYSQQPSVYNSPSNDIVYTNPYEEQYTQDVAYNVPTLHHQKHNYVQTQTERALYGPKLNYNLEEHRYTEQPVYSEQPRYRTQPLTAAEYTSPETNNYYVPEYQQKYYSQVNHDRRVYQQPRANVYSSTAATPITEEQEEDGPYSTNLERSTEAPYNSVSSTPSSRINYLLLPQRNQEYIYSQG